MRIFITQSNYPVYFTQKCAYSIPYFPVTLFAQVTSFTWNTLSPLCLLDSYFVSEVQLKNLLCLEFSIYIHSLSLLLNYIIQYLLQQICSWCTLNKFGWVSGWTSCIHTTVSWGRKVQWGLPGDPAQCQNMNKSTGLLAVCSLRTDLLSSSSWCRALISSQLNVLIHHIGAQWKSFFLRIPEVSKK